MEVTQRCGRIVAVCGTLTLWAVIAANPLFVVGAGLLAGWLLSRQILFVYRASVSRDRLTVDMLPGRTHVTAGETTPLTLAVDVAPPVLLSTSVTVAPPYNDAVTVELRSAESSASSVESLSWPVAGRYSLDDVTVTFRDRAGLFEQSLGWDGGPSIHVEPRAPRDVHVGEGGDALVSGFGEHDAGRLGSGLEPAEVRKYVPGDAFRRIDWKATARLNEPHVREFEAETDRETILMFDQRRSMATGEEGQQKLDYVRQVALAFVDSASELNDPLGYCAIGSDGVLGIHRPGMSAEILGSIREELIRASPMASATAGASATDLTTVRERSDLLAEDPSAFGGVLAPYLRTRQSYVETFEEDPLFQAIQTYAMGSSAIGWTVIFTDDTDRAELREAVRLASRGGRYVVVFLTPTVLFEPVSVTDVEAAYERYVDFEEFRRELAAYDRVDAYEVGPGDRLSSVLTAGQSRRRGQA